MLCKLFIFIIIGVVQCGVINDTKCSSHEFACASGECIPMSHLCDGTYHCADHGDEALCELGYHRHKRDIQQCSKLEYKCKNGECVSFDSQCDGKADCQDGSDETYALCRNNKCQSNWFRCTYGACVDGNALCNNITECVDQSDELHPTCHIHNNNNILRGMFDCGDGMSIRAHQLCDGARHCANSADESVLHCGHTTCAKYLLQCAYGACVDAGALCDQKIDCADGSDESDDICNTTTTTITTTQLPSMRCTLPPYPEFGSYVVMPFADEDAVLQPGDMAALVRLRITCKEGFGFQGSGTYACYYGIWVGEMPQCTRYCKLSSDPSVSHRCVVPASNGGTRACAPYEPPGTIAIPACTTHYYAPAPLPRITCLAGSWTHSPLCQPDCGTVTAAADALVFGGTSAMETQVPWHAAVYNVNNNNNNNIGGTLICGGTILSNDKVITAAHCFWSRADDGPHPIANYAISAGKLYRGRQDGRDARAQHSALAALHIPQLYHDADAHYREDIAIAVLATPLVYSAVVRPVCVSFDVDFEKHQLKPGALGMAAGWGYVSANGMLSAPLKVVWLPYVDADTCYRLSPDNYKPHISRDKFCAGYMNGTAALCKGDSGGGLTFVSQQLSRDRHYLRGIASTAPPNAHKCNTQALTAFTSLMHHEQFIAAHIT